MSYKIVSLVLLSLVAGILLAETIQTKITFVPYPASSSEIRVEAVGSCGEGCGQYIKWISFIDSGHQRYSTGNGIMSYLEVVRDTKMLVIAELREGSYDGKIIKVGGFRLIYDGTIIKLKEPVIPVITPTPVK